MKRYFPIIFVGLIVLSGCATLFGRDDEEERADRAEEARSLAEEQHAQEVERIHAALQERDVTLGMRPDDVVTAWGQPGEVETAGDPYQGNQRWFYYTGLSSRWSLSSARIIYFEQGRVVGWETR
jgi:hypothetical protein